MLSPRRVWAFFAAYLALGLFIYRDYGITSDEPISRWTGYVNYLYIVSGDKALLRDFFRYYGPLFEFFLFAMEKIGRFADLKDVFIARHLATFLACFGGVVAFYALCRKRFSETLALAGCLFLVLSPRFFAQSFYNSKDAVFLAAFTTAMLTLVHYHEKPGVARALLHALATAAACAVRIPGFFIVIFTPLFSVRDLRRRAGSLAAFGAGFFLFLVTFWPVLRTGPVHGLVNAVAQQGRFPFFAGPGDLSGTVLYCGQFVPATELPWHYIPVWIAVTTPPVNLLFFAAGVLALFMARRAGAVEKAALGWFLVPWAYLVASRTVIYDDWRHLLFIYPGILLIALTGLEFLLARVKAKRVVWAAVAAGLIPAAYFMAQNHPLQNVYFNRLAGRDMREIRSRFEMDYCALSGRLALDRFFRKLETKPGEPVWLYWDNGVGVSNALYLTKPDWEKLRFADTPDKADYFIGLYRWHPQDYPFPDADRVFSVAVGGTDILTVYKTVPKTRVPLVS